MKPTLCPFFRPALSSVFCPVLAALALALTAPVVWVANVKIVVSAAVPTNIML